jgi:hypothetical protein
MHVTFFVRRIGSARIRVKGNLREVVYEKQQQNTNRKEYGSRTLSLSPS